VYENDQAVANDKYVQSWAKSIAEHVGGFPPSITTIASLVDIVTMMQWMPSVQHSAVNYLQKFWTGYTPMAPPALFGTWPKTLADIDEEKLLKMMPNKFQEAVSRVILDTLSQPTDEDILTHWGYYAEKHGFGFIANRAAALKKSFADLRVAMEQRALAESGATRSSDAVALNHDPIAYRVLQPQNVAMSVLI